MSMIYLVTILGRVKNRWLSYSPVDVRYDSWKIFGSTGVFHGGQMPQISLVVSMMGEKAKWYFGKKHMMFLHMIHKGHIFR